ncbi:MAG: DUF1232 domain-containing protein [Pseudomonadota bacterium]|nr:DUF1232 domain-containing protein [Pseudomonadota bacterium]
MATDSTQYSNAYRAALVLPMLQRVCSKAGLDLVSRALQLYYLARSPDIPAWAKASIFAALGYLVVTPDAVPDITPVLGFVDDLAVLTSALAGLSGYVSPEIRAKVLLKLQEWFGREVDLPLENLPESKT